MSDYKIKTEIKNLQAIGISEEFATLIAGAKYGNLDVTSGILNEFTEENQDIKQMIEQEGFQEFVPIDTTGSIILKNQDDENKIEELSNDILEITDDKN
jgi:hypothetical protein